MSIYEPYVFNHPLCAFETCLPICQMSSSQYKVRICQQSRSHLEVLTNSISCCAYYTGESSCEVKTEADSSDHTEHSHDDKSRSCVSNVDDKQFMRQHNLMEQTSSDIRENWHSCAECDKRFSSRSSLSHHMVTHAGIYRCAECGKCCGSGCNLAVHRRGHSGEKRFECTVCGKRFKTSRNLVVHSRSHSGERPYKCQLCDWAFKDLGHLITHRRIHTGEKPYQCSVCNRSFTRPYILQLHSRIHDGEKRYKCRTCDKAFSRSGSLTVHMRVHTGEKPYKCSCLLYTSPSPRD